MNKKEYQFSYEEYSSIDELTKEDALILNQARELTAIAYAPYSNFHVSAVARLVNGEIVTGTNQENASYPVSICAERSMLSTAAALFPNVAIDTIAITYHNFNGTSNRPISPCGMCRQALAEYENRTSKPIRLILSGMDGQVYIIERATQLLPMTFKGDDLK